MKITLYQMNGKILKEMHKAIKQQNLKELEQLNRQAEAANQAKVIRTQWVKPNSVDVMA
jgi:hypothetical protein